MQTTVNYFVNFILIHRDCKSSADVMESFTTFSTFLFNLFFIFLLFIVFKQKNEMILNYS